MANGYKILWTDNALKELATTYLYLEKQFTENEMKKLSLEIAKTLRLISINPSLFPKSEFQEVRKAVVKKFNTMYYREIADTVIILSFFSNRQDLDNRRI